MKKKTFLASLLAILCLFLALMPFLGTAATTTPVLYGTNVPTADSTANNTTSDVIGNKADAVATGAVSATKSLMAYAKQSATNTESIITAIATPRCIEKSDGIVADNTTDSLFVITGGPVRCKIVGVVTTPIGGTANMKLQITTDAPAGTVDLNAAAVAITSDAAGTIYQNVGATSVFTPSAGLGYALVDPVTVEETEFILTPGTVKAHSSAAQTGNIKWYMTYVPLSPDSAVAAAE